MTVRNRDKTKTCFVAPLPPNAETDERATDMPPIRLGGHAKGAGGDPRLRGKIRIGREDQFEAGASGFSGMFTSVSSAVSPSRSRTVKLGITTFLETTVVLLSGSER